MCRVRKAWSVSLCFCGVLVSIAPANLRADEAASNRADNAATPCEKASAPQTPNDSASLAALIDNYIVARWGNTTVPAALADDAEYARRAYLDLTGCVPTVSALREFLADTAPDKRQKLVDRLLDSPQYARHFSAVWLSLFLPELDSNDQIRYLSIEFKSWLQIQLRQGVGYNRLIRELLTTPLDNNSMNGFRRGSYDQTPRPTAFYQAKEMKAENLASASARVFLGIRVDCAQCHNHPFTAWKQEDFWAFAAFFDKAQQQAGGDVNSTLNALLAGPAKKDAIEISIPDTKTTVKGRFLGSSEAAVPSGASTRETVADWITADSNPYFARTAVNRTWANFFGTGIVDPIDDFDPSNPASHPELLDELARQFIAHGYDQKFLIRAIMASRPYQLTSKFSHPSQRDRRLFARMAPKGLTSEQLLNSLSQITSANRTENSNPFAEFNRNQNDGGLRELFNIRNEAATDRQLTVLQALALMNGGAVAGATDPLNGRLIASISDFPGMTTEERVETLFLATLSRPPRAEESARLTQYVAGGGPEGSERMALCDVLWSLVNCSEFLVNH